MKLGFYYHIPLNSSGEGLKIPAYLGVFLDSLARELTSLTLFLHEANTKESLQCDYVLKERNIQYVSLGLKNSAWARFLWPEQKLKRIKSRASSCDIILVRAPSPLAPTFFKMFNKGLASAAADNKVSSIGTFIGTLTIALQPDIEFFSFEVEFFTLGAEMGNLLGAGKLVEMGGAYVKVLTSLVEIEGCFL